MSKSKKSLTRESFLTDLEIKPIVAKMDDGTILHILPVSELRRSRRMSMMFDKNGEVSKSFLEKRRIYTLIDHLCDENGEPWFTEKDANKLLELDSIKIDRYYAAVDKALGGELGNE